MNSNEPQQNPAEPLTPQDLADLATAVGTFGDAIVNLENRRRGYLIALTALAVTAVVLSVVVGSIAWRVRDNAKTIKGVQCSLYSLVLSGGYHPERHTSDLPSYNHVYGTIVHDNNRLGCVTVPDPTKGTT